MSDAVRERQLPEEALNELLRRVRDLEARGLGQKAGGVLGYAQVTANQSGITSEVNLTGLSVTVTVGASRRIRITAQGRFTSTVANDIPRLHIKESTTLFQLHDGRVITAGNGYTFNTQVVLSPSSGSHTYQLRASRAIGSGSVTMEAHATYPAFILVEDIGPA